MKIAKEINCLPTFLTFRCNVGCEYCINRDSELTNAGKEMSGKEWVEGINGLELESELTIELEGGEPTQHKDFYYIIENIKYPVDLLTNLQFDIDEFISKVDPKWFKKGDKDWYKSIRASYHPHYMDAKETINKLVKLQDAGFSVGLSSVNLPEMSKANMEMTELARKNKIYYTIKEFLGYRNGSLHGFFKYPNALLKPPETVMCKTIDISIAPDGFMYKCHRDLYKGENALAHISEKNSKIEYKYRNCDKFGECNPCDIKEKVNRHLEPGFSNVEIKKENE